MLRIKHRKHRKRHLRAENEECGELRERLRALVEEWIDRSRDYLRMTIDSDFERGRSEATYECAEQLKRVIDGEKSGPKD